MNALAIIALNLTTWGILVGGIVFCVRHEQRGKARRRELEHDERMRAIELGVPPDDAAVAFRETISRDGQTFWHSIGRQGYLYVNDFGYAFARFARTRDEDGREWERELRLDVRAAFREAMWFLDAEAAGELPNGGD